MKVSLDGRVEGARIVHVEAVEWPSKWVLVFEHRGTDDNSGYVIVDAADVHFADGGDPDAWRDEIRAANSHSRSSE